MTIEGPGRLAPGATGSYTLTITGGQRDSGGLDVSATSGTLAVPDGSSDLRLASDEIVHAAPKPSDSDGSITFAYLFTAPSQPGAVTMYGAGNSVDGNGQTSGDMPGTTTFAISVIEAQASATSPPATSPAPTSEVTATPPAPGTPTPTPEPSATDDVGESSRILLPYTARSVVLVQPTITPIPPTATATSPPRLVTKCVNVVAQGTFEGATDQWSKAGENVGTFGPNELIQPHSGQRMLGIIPENSDSSFAIYRRFGFDSPDVLVSARLIYHWAGLTDDPFADSDAFLAGIMAENQDTCGADCSINLELRHNQSATPNWRRREFDIRDRLLSKAGRWTGWHVFFGAANDVGLMTGWFVDDVSLEICKRVPEGYAFEEQAPQDAPGEPLDARMELDLSRWSRR